MSLAVASAAADNVMLSGMARALVQHQMLSAEEAADIQKKTDPAKAKFIDVLVSSDGLSALNLARFTADTFGLPLVDLSAFDAGMLLTDLIDPKLLAETLIVPIAKRGNRLTVLLSDPTDLQAIDRIKFRTQATVDPIVVEHDKLRKFVEQLSQSSTGQTKAALDDDPSDFQPEDADEGLALPAAVRPSTARRGTPNSGRAGTTGAAGTAANDTVLPGIARALVQNQVISPEQASAIQKKVVAAQGRFIDELISSGQLNAVTLARFASDTFGLPLADLAALDAGMLVTDLIDAKLMAETLIVPIAKRGNRLTVLLSDPTDLQAIDRIKFRTQATVDPIVVEHDKLRKFVEQLSQSSTGQTKPGVDDDPSSFQPEDADEGLALPAALLPGLARALIQNQVISPEQASAIQKKAAAAQGRFIDELISSGQMNAVTLARFASDTFGLPLADLAALDAGMLVTDLIDAKLLAETLIVPIAKRGNRLTVLLSDPTDLQAIDRIKFRTQATVDPIVVEHDKLRKFVEQLSQSSTGQTKPGVDDDPSSFQPEDADEGLALPAALLPGLARALIQNQVISPEQASAIQKKAAAAQGRFIDELISSGQMNAVTLARFASDTFGLPLADLAALDAGMLVTDLIDAKLLAETLIVPIAKRGNRLTVLLSDPTDLQAIDRIKFRTQATVDPIVVEHDKLRKFVEQLSQSSTGQTKPGVDDDPSSFQPEDADEGLALPAALLPGLARALIQNQVISSEQASAIQKKAAAAQGRFIDELISSGQMNAVTLARFASDTFGLPLVDLAALDAGMLVTDLIDAKLLAETRIVPIAKRGNRLTVLLSDPTDLQAIDRIKFRAQATVDPIVVEHDKLRKFVEQLSQSLSDQMDAGVDDDPDNFQPEEADEGLVLPAALLPGIARALVHNQLISPEQASAIQKKAAAAQGRFIDELISSGQLRAATLARFAADTFGLPLVDLAAFDASMLVTDLIDPKLLTETLIVPIAKRGNRLTVLLSDPTDLQAIDRVKFRAQAPVDPIVVEHDKLQKFIEEMSQSLTAQLEPEEEENYFKDLPIGIEDGDIRVFDENTPLRAAK